MRNLLLRLTPEAAYVEIEGELDAVSGHDLRGAVRRTVEDGTRLVLLDLSRVLAVDVDGLAALQWCDEYAAHAGAEVACVACSRPAARMLRGLDAAQWVEPWGRKAEETRIHTTAQATRKSGSGWPVSNHSAAV